MSTRENERVREDSTLNDWKYGWKFTHNQKKIFFFSFVPHSYIFFLDCSCSHLYDLTLNNLSSAKLTTTCTAKFTLLSRRSFLRFHSLSTDLICGILLLSRISMILLPSSSYFLRNIHNIEGAYTHWILRIKKHSWAFIVFFCSLLLSFGAVAFFFVWSCFNERKN